MKNITFVLFLLVLNSCIYQGDMPGEAPPISAYYEILDKDSVSLLNYENFSKLQISFENNGKEVFLDDLRPFVNLRGNVSFRSMNMIALYAKPPKKYFTIWLDDKKLGILEVFTVPTIPFYSPRQILFNNKELVPQFRPISGFIAIGINPEMYFTILLD